MRVIMDWKKVSTDDLQSRFFIEMPEANPWMSYYETINLFRVLFESQKFQQYVSGYYVFSLHRQFPCTFRLVVFSPEDTSMEAEQEIENFIIKNKLPEKRDERIPPKKYSAVISPGDPELRCRQFETLETLIGLEIMKKDLLNAQSLMATYRWQVFKARQPRASYFKPTFERDSSAYLSLSPNDQVFLYSCLSNYKWTHFLVNLVLGFDETNYSLPEESYSISRINKDILEPRKAPFRIPEDWKPQVG